MQLWRIRARVYTSNLPVNAIFRRLDAMEEGRGDYVPTEERSADPLQIFFYFFFSYPNFLFFLNSHL